MVPFVRLGAGAEIPPRCGQWLTFIVKGVMIVRPSARRAGKNRNRCFLKVEKNMFVTPVFYLGAEKNRFTIALQYHSCELVNLFSRGLPEKLGLSSIVAARGCLKHLFFSKSSETAL